MEKIRDEYDVVVVGGGIAGVSAAISSARNGMKVCLIEKSCVLGGLATAGRCISADSAWDIIRAIPTCALTGEISGTASALFVKENSESFSSIDIKKLQNKLKNQGVIIK